MEDCRDGVGRVWAQRPWRLSGIITFIIIIFVTIIKVTIKILDNNVVNLLLNISRMTN